MTKPNERDVAFAVAARVAPDSPRPVVAVDGPVEGADVRYDHHATGEAVNLLAIPEQPPAPATIATTMLDGDAVISAAVVLLRAAGEGSVVKAHWPVLYEAAHWCDHLIASGRYPEAERAGLGLHCWLKDRGLAMGEALAWAAGEVRTRDGSAPQVMPSERTRSAVFRDLTRAVVSGLRLGDLPCDFAYLDRLGAMEHEARRSIALVDGPITVLRPDAFIDPLAMYRVVETDAVVVARRHRDGGGVHYTLGVHPRAYGRVDIRPALAALARKEAGWGGRATAGGSPLDRPSRLHVDDVVAALRATMEDSE
jgi:hypothetical protein